MTPDLAPRSAVLTMPVDVVSYPEAAEFVVRHAQSNTPGYVCVANVHMVMEALDSAAFHEVISNAALVVPDGMPLVWALRGQGHGKASRVRGPTLVNWISELAAEEGVGIALYGGSPEAVRAFAAELETCFPGIEIVCSISPPFRQLTEEERLHDAALLRESGAGVVFVGLGCPKQEKWMAAHYREIPAVLVGVGAAFDINSKLVREAPGWMQAAGLEWLFRLVLEPRRLWRRYAVHNTRFITLLALDYLRRLHQRGTSAR